MLKQGFVNYNSPGNSFKGTYFYDDALSNKKPVILVAHAWRGQDEFARQKAKELAQSGYIGFAVDLYGNAKEVTTNEEAQELMVPLFLNRKELRSRIVAAFNAAKTLEQADPQQIGAIGFCFGGLTVIELLRSGVAVKGVVTFHGLLGHTLGELQAQKHPESPPMQGALLILHGHDDPLVSSEDIRAIQDEMTQAHVDWEMDIYGHTKHAFTNPMATDAATPMLFNPEAAARSLQRMNHFFQNIFQIKKDI